MAKKVVVMVVLAAFAAGGVFAQEAEAPAKKKGLFSAGIGGFVGSQFGGGFRGETNGVEVSTSFPYFGGGAFAYFDASYAELSLSYFMGSGKPKIKTGENESEASDISYTSFNIGLLVKYPVTLGNKLTVFPLLGIDYQVMPSVKQDGKELKWMYNSDGEMIEGSKDVYHSFSALWVKFGGGGDFMLTNALYLRGELLYGIRLANGYEEMSISRDDGAETMLAHGFNIKAAIGFKF